MSDTTYILEQTPDADTFGGRLFRARDAAGTSIRDLAWQLSVNTSTVRGWENDRSQPSAHRLTNIAGLLGVSLSWLLHGVGAAPAEAEDDAQHDARTNGLTRQLATLRRLHASTGDIIARLQQDIGRLESGARPEALAAQPAE